MSKGVREALEVEIIGVSVMDKEWMAVTIDCDEAFSIPSDDEEDDDDVTGPLTIRMSLTAGRKLAPYIGSKARLVIEVDESA